MSSIQSVLKLLKERPRGTKGNLLHVVRETLSRKTTIINLAKKQETPFYLIDEKKLRQDIRNFKKNFDTHLNNHQAYYAIKANYHPIILKTVVEEGMGLDASSERELKFALDAGAKKILLTGPGKSDKVLELALTHAEKTIINLDSFEELQRLGKLSQKRKTSIRAGIRFFSSHHGAWSKFGIPLSELGKFWDEAKQYPLIKLEGLHFHISLNLNAEKYCAVLRELGEFLKTKFPSRYLPEIKFIDIGGGYYPDNVEGFYPWSDHYPWTLTGGHFLKLAGDYYGEATHFKDKYYITRAESPETMAKKIAQTINRFIKPIVDCDITSEPGRIISNNSTSLIMRIADVKDNVIITDGGINAAGWEFGQHFYFPIINLTHPDLKEKHLRIYGSLCTPRDFWGYHIFSKKNETDDIIAIPNYGAYKFTLAQEFIRPIPPTLTLKTTSSALNPKTRSHKRIQTAGLNSEIKKTLNVITK